MRPHRPRAWKGPIRVRLGEHPRGTGRERRCQGGALAKTLLMSCDARQKRSSVCAGRPRGLLWSTVSHAFLVSFVPPQSRRVVGAARFQSRPADQCGGGAVLTLDPASEPWSRTQTVHGHRRLSSPEASPRSSCRRQQLTCSSSRERSSTWTSSLATSARTMHLAVCSATVRQFFGGGRS